MSSTSGLRRTLEDELAESGGSLTVRPIGVVRSIYRLCVGTPRQGLLAPHARGRIELSDASRADAVDGLEGFSHVWIIFIFHLNTTGRKPVSNKIAPPARGGSKVGLLATRSPHRFNPVGMTLCKLDRIEQTLNKTNKKIVVLHVSGLDLVDGTPVLDIKPYVPLYDAPLHPSECVLPEWVTGGLATRREVEISQEAREQLNNLLDNEAFEMEFYGKDGESLQDCVSNVIQCIQEVLAIDVRSKWQTKKARQGKSHAERANRLKQELKSAKTTENDTNISSPVSSASGDNLDCTQQIDNLLIHYMISQTASTARLSSEGNGAEDCVTVTAIEALDRDRSQSDGEPGTTLSLQRSDCRTAR